MPAMSEVIRVSGGVVNLGDFLKDAMMSQTFADVALCCTGGQRFLAHRLVLSAASPYLQEVLLAHGKVAGHCDMITVILAEVEGNDLAAVLGFVYTGSTAVPRGRLEAFSKTADALRIRIPPFPVALGISDPVQVIQTSHTMNFGINRFENFTPNPHYHMDFKGEYIRPLRSTQEPENSENELIKYNLSPHYVASVNREMDYCLNLKKTDFSPRDCRIPRLHVANRVSASPWCQLARPHHFPRQQPIIIETRNHLEPTFANVPVGPFSSLKHSPSREESERSLNARISAACGGTITSEILAQDLCPVNSAGELHISSKTPGVLEIQQVHDEDIQNCREGSPKILTTLLTNSELVLDSTIKKVEVSSHKNEGKSRESVETIRWSDSNNNNNNNNNGLESLSDDIASSEDPHKCRICGKTFVSRASLKVHGRTHTGEKPFRCADCGKEFSQLRNYKYHRSIHEGTGEFAATCPECGKSFNDRGYLGSHMKIHRNRKEYVCQECGKSFNQRVAYNMHVRIHTGVKPHHCNECGKSFSRKMLLKQHLRTHSGERPYQCHICQKAFADRSNMTLHTRLHSGLKPYQCDICSKAFTKKHHLKTHLNYHTGTKPYACPNCGLTFSQSSNMRTHHKKCIINKPPPDSEKNERHLRNDGVPDCTNDFELQTISQDPNR